MEEYYDLLDENRNPTGKKHKRGEPMPQGCYRLIVCSWIVNNKWEFLIAQRSHTKSHAPNLWETPGGCVLSGEDSLTATIREAHEEIGINLENGVIFATYREDECFFDHWLFRQEFNLSELVLQEDETSTVKITTQTEILELIKQGVMFREPEPVRFFLKNARFGNGNHDREIEKEIEQYNNLPCLFDDFISIPTLSDGEIFLVCIKKSPGNPDKALVPQYHFAICKEGEKIGNISLRIGYSPRLYYGGNIAYDIHKNYRGFGYATRACLLLESIAKAHNMEKLLITNDPANTASRRVCEKLGARLVRIAHLPEWHDLYKEGARFGNIFEWSI